MAKIEGYIPGSFCWAELASKDVDAAKAFYSDMFGWTPVDMPMPQGVYTIFQVDGNDAAALCSPPGASGQWAVYFSVESADDAASKIAAGGGKVVAGPFDAHVFGRMAVAQDPQGAFFSVWQPKQSYGASHGGPLGMVGWVELATPDAAGAAAFYTGLFGWGTKPETGVAEAPYTEWINGGKAMGGMLPMKGDEWKGVPPHWTIYITVANCDERHARALELGAKACVPPTDIPNVGRFSVLFDPQGAAFCLIAMK
ncbi:MAG: VOC family protein [Candidatus Solibacter sp.]